MTVRIAVRAARTAAAALLAQRGALAFTAAFYLMVTAVLSTLWSAAAGDGTIAGYTAIALVWYVTASEAATIPLDYRLIERTGEDIGSGEVAVELLRPASVVGVRIAAELGRVVPKLAVCLAVGLAFSTTVHGAPPSWVGLAVAVPSLAIVLACNVIAQHAFAGAAFWIADAKSAWFIYQKLVFVLGGMLLPIEVLPDAVADVARWLPTAAMAYAPARIASGHIELELLAVQVGWLVVLAALAVRVFASGERRLQVVGG